MMGYVPSSSPKCPEEMNLPVVQRGGLLLPDAIVVGGVAIVIGPAGKSRTLHHSVQGIIGGLAFEKRAVMVLAHRHSIGFGPRISSLPYDPFPGAPKRGPRIWPHRSDLVKRLGRAAQPADNVLAQADKVNRDRGYQSTYRLSTDGSKCGLPPRAIRHAKRLEGDIIALQGAAGCPPSRSTITTKKTRHLCQPPSQHTHQLSIQSPSARGSRSRRNFV